ncbi:MAG: serine/threonine protein kinase [Planctomycetes bacterium]|nr:serine/threonine protein kinase [Planctomycetota bacterium]MCA8945357.1 serine/threonine protein kinase [Planctomycetota bacterium]
MANKQEMLLMALAVKQGLIQKEKVQECMDLQAALEEQKGVSLPLLQIALKKKYLTEEQAANLGGAGGVDIPGVGDSISLDQARRISIFDVHKEIGQGGMATVFLATHKATHRQCALKVLFPKHTKNAKFVERFIREGKLLKEFECESIAKGYEYGRAGKENPLYFMSMEYIDGPSIQDLLDRDGPFDEQKSIYVITEAAKALAYMQERGVVHRDVKPDNIMWSKEGRVMLVDLGFATMIRKDLAGQFEDETCGTVQYISPEQAKGMADLDIRADIYSLGATLYHMVTGELPFTGKDSMEVMAKQVMEGLNQHSLKGGKISVHMHYFIEKMMSKERDFRYQTAREVVDDITEVLDGAADLQYNPSADTSSPFNFALGGDPHSSQRITKVGHSTGKFQPISQGSSGRMKPDGSSVRLPGARSTAIPPTRSGGANSTSVRKPVPSGNSTSSVRKPLTKPGTSVRMPGSKSVKLPPVKKPGDK